MIFSLFFSTLLFISLLFLSNKFNLLNRFVSINEKLKILFCALRAKMSIITFLIIVLHTILLWFVIIIANYVLLFATNLNEDLITINSAIYVTVLMSFAYAIPAAPSSIGTLNYSVILALQIAAREKQIDVTPQIQNEFIMVSSLFYLISITPDLISGFFLLLIDRKTLQSLFKGDF
jgi:hypothetical protein